MAISTQPIVDILSANIYENITGDISAVKLKEVFEILIISLDEAYDIIGTSFISNSATSAPSLATLNSTYGLKPEGFEVYYPSITTGPKLYTKLTGTNSGAWKEETPTYVA